MRSGRHVNRATQRIGLRMSQHATNRICPKMVPTVLNEWASIGQIKAVQTNPAKKKNTHRPQGVKVPPVSMITVPQSRHWCCAVMYQSLLYPPGW